MEGSFDMVKVWNLAKHFQQSESMVFPEEEEVQSGVVERLSLESVRRALNRCTREMIESKVAAKYEMCCNPTPLTGS